MNAQEHIQKPILLNATPIKTLYKNKTPLNSFALMQSATARLLLACALGSVHSYAMEGARSQVQRGARASTRRIMQIGVKTDKGLDERYAQIAAALPHGAWCVAPWGR